MPSATLWKLRRLASRARRVVERRKLDSDALSVYAITTPPKAGAFIAAYDTAAKYSAAWLRELGEGKGAVGALLAGLRGWLPLVVRDVPNFSSTDYGDKPEVPDDVIEDAGRLRDFVGENTGKDGKALLYKDKCQADLDARLKVANKEWPEAEAADKKYQTLLQAVRTTAEEFEKELIALRKSLAAGPGRHDKDYQKLRTERASVEDADDDPGAPKAPPPVKPTAAGVTEPAK